MLYDTMSSSALSAILCSNSGVPINPGSSGGTHAHGGLPLNGGAKDEKNRGGPELGWRHDDGELGGDGEEEEDELIVIADLLKQYIRNQRR